jgi:hypothetical protein
MTPALSWLRGWRQAENVKEGRTSKYRNTPSRRRQALRCRTTTAGIAGWGGCQWTNRVRPPPQLTLLPQLRLPLLHRRDDHIAHARIGQPVQMRTEPERLDDVQRLGPAVVRTVEHRAYGQTQRHAEFVARGATSACIIVSGWCPAVGRGSRTGLLGHFLR